VVILLGREEQANCFACGRDSKASPNVPFSRMERASVVRRRNIATATFRALDRIPPSPPVQNTAARCLFCWAERSRQTALPTGGIRKAEPCRKATGEPGKEPHSIFGVKRSKILM
jgi:hypothetical protein